ncbi:MAG TPA: hypothetical protein VKB56_10860 [Terriglobales bacterium]|nr:hypothetical protein [Terriglobales bacterium]
MLRGRKLLGAVLSLMMIFALAAPAFAGENGQITLRDLKGLRHPSAHRWFYATAGGALLGLGIGRLVGGGGPNYGKGLMLGGGIASDMYLLSHHDTASGWREWAFVGSNTMIGGGAGWALCGCNTGLVSGLLIGSGGTVFYNAFGGAHGLRAAVDTTKDAIKGIGGH